MMNETEAPLPATLTVVETAAFLGLAVQSTYKGIGSGDTPHVKVGKRIRSHVAHSRRCSNRLQTGIAIVLGPRRESNRAVPGRRIVRLRGNRHLTMIAMLRKLRTRRSGPVVVLINGAACAVRSKRATWGWAAMRLRVCGRVRRLRAAPMPR